MSCLFDSMVKLLRQYGVAVSSSQELRNLVIRYMQANPGQALGDRSRTRTSSPGRCGKCDMPMHGTSACPWFPKPREDSDGNVTIGEWVRLVSGDLRLTPDAYVRAMGNAGTWGGGMELAVLSKMFNIRIQIYRARGLVASFDTCSGALADFHLHWSGTHYTPLRVVETDD